MKAFKDLLLKKAKEGKFLSDDEKEAKMESLKGIKEVMSEMMGDDLNKMKGMKKVTVASPTEEGLKEGLAKAEDVVGEKLDSEDSDEEEEACPECESEDMLMEKPELSKEEKIKKLEEELAKLKGESEEAMA